MRRLRAWLRRRAVLRQSEAARTLREESSRTDRPDGYCGRWSDE